MDINTVLTVVLLSVMLVLTAAVIGLCIAAGRKWGELVSFISPVAENEESPLAMVLDDVSRKMGHAIAMEVKTTFMGKESGFKRGEQALAGDLAMDLAADQQPLLMGLLDGFPTLKKRLLKNPSLVGAALSVLGGNKPPSGSAPTGGGGGGNNQSAFQL